MNCFNLNKNGRFALVAALLACPLLARAQNPVKGAGFAASKVVVGASLPETISEENFGQAQRWFLDTPLPRALSDAEVEFVAARVASEDGMVAGSAARFLANARLNPVSVRMEPILERFKREVEHPTTMVSAWPSYLSGRALVRTQFLLALDHLEKPELVEALQNERKADISPAVRLWLGVALGYVGDESVADEVKVALEAERDPSMRAVLLGAYAHSAKEKAIPTLEGFLQDKTVTASGCFGPYYGVQMVARGELARLRDAEVGNGNAEKGNQESRVTEN